MSRLSAQEAARRCASELEDAQERLVGARTKSMNALALRLSRMKDTANFPGYMLALFGMDYDARVTDGSQGDVISVLNDFDLNNHNKVFASSHATKDGISPRLHVFGYSALRSVPNDGSNETLKYGERNILTVARFRVAKINDQIVGEVIVPTQSVSAKLFSKTPETYKPEPAEFTAMSVIRAVNEQTPHTVRVTPVLWNGDIVDGRNLRDTSLAMANLRAIQLTFDQIPRL